ncbi:1-deoxy-D-xylulose-5-phosphate synthase [uncultured Veillonella sp.]|uniref:1-deoxy-D-xylulose-5-phosphate synthase n=1 Tax=uncultured Veillonella sp. TaxID=159268 RepID=UPI0026274446|nr:1-deoxy-D-xylulose-5-phosphate synthase [uncultured Veillonella sp.]
MNELKLLNTVNSPKDIKSMSVDQLKELAQEIREVLIERVTTTGGHMAPNLGFVEPTLALHYVFDSPTDKFVFDVSHQSYIHKILTGRKEAFTDPASYTKYSGYTNPNESEHDFFTIGHTSTAVSLATGLAKARDLKKEAGNVIAILGDGSLSGGEAMEGLNVAATLNSNFIVLFNDNDMSIAPNEGGVYKNLKELRDTKGQASNNYFKAMGLDYVFIEDGHDLQALIDTFKTVKDSQKPVVIHMVTVKGKGYALAEADKETYHYIMGKDFDVEAYSKEEHYDEIIAEFLVKKMKADPTVIGLTAGVPGIAGFNPARRAEVGAQFVDVGIAEEHMVAMAAGLAKNGAKPVILDAGTFLQRTYDQLTQDLALNSNAATILSFPLGGGISSMDATHSSAFDMAMMNSIPNLTVLSPATKDELLSMLDWSLEQTDGPVMIRVPGGNVQTYEAGNAFDGSLQNEVVETGDTVAILGLGAFYDLGLRTKAELEKTLSIKATLVNPRLSSAVDSKVLDSLKANHTLVVTLEDGVLDGGFGEKVARYYGPSHMKVITIGMTKEVNDRVPMEELIKRYHLSPELIVEDIKATLAE